MNANMQLGNYPVAYLRQIAVLCVTYGAGGHNVVNTVAGSFSERVSILVVSGGPGEEKRKPGVLIHHQAKEIESQFHIFQEITFSTKIIMDGHIGAISPIPIRQRIEEADLVIHLGALLTNMNLGSQPQYIHRGR